MGATNLIHWSKYCKYVSEIVALTNNKKKYIDKMPCDKKDNCHY